MGVLRLTKERQSIRGEKDGAIQTERDGILRSPWEMHSSGQIRLRARRPSARIIVVESPLLTTAYGIVSMYEHDFMRIGISIIFHRKTWADWLLFSDQKTYRHAAGLMRWIF